MGGSPLLGTETAVTVHSVNCKTSFLIYFSSLFQSLAQLENLCKQLYETTDTATRLQAEKALVEFTNSPDCLSKCQLLLERGSVCKAKTPPAGLSPLDVDGAAGPGFCSALLCLAHAACLCVCLHL